jgi:hypothetical protein
MSDYTRSTRTCAFDHLRPELRRAILEHARAHEMGSLESEIIQCCETKSERKPAGSFAGWFESNADKLIYTGALFTAEWLVWARYGDVSGTHVTAARLVDIRVKPFLSLLVRDNGLEIFGYVGDAKGRMRGYIGMGPEPAAQEFCQGVQQAVETINPPNKKFPSWMGG